MSGIDDAVERADYAMDDHYHAQEYLMDAIDDLESVLDDLESAGGAAREFERFADVMADYLEEDTERTARQAAKIEELVDRVEDAYSGGDRGRGGYGWQPGSPSWSPWMGQQQQQQQWFSPGWNNWQTGWNTGWDTDYSETEDASEWVEEEWSDWNGWNQGWNWSGNMFQSQSMGMGGMNQVQYIGVWY